VSTDQNRVGPPEQTDFFARATGYPYSRHLCPVLFDPARGTHPAELIRLGEQGEAVLEGLARPIPVHAATVRIGARIVVIENAVVVIAAGSNASPHQLQRKYAGRADARPMLVMPAIVHGACSVYSAHVTAYGSIAATLHPDPAGKNGLHVLVMPVTELAPMNATESLGINYVLAAPTGVSADVGGYRIARPLAYVSRRGALTIDGRPVRLVELDGGAGARPAASQIEMLDRARRLMEWEGPLEAFVAAMIADPDYRRAVTSRLAADAVPWHLDGSEVLAGC